MGDNGERLKAVLERCRQHGINLSHDRCKFREPAVTFLDHRIDREGLRPTERNVEAIVQVISPSDIGKLRCFLGMLTFYSRFLPNMQLFFLHYIS